MWRRLKHFNNVLDDRISEFKDLGAQRRFILFLPNVDDIDEYIRQKVEEKAKQKKLKEPGLSNFVDLDTNIQK